MRLPADVAQGGRHKVIKSSKYFGMKLQLKEENVKQQALASKRTTEIRIEGKKIAKLQKQQAVFSNCDRAAMLEFLGLPSTGSVPYPDFERPNNTNDMEMRVEDPEKEWSFGESDSRRSDSDSDDFDSNELNSDEDDGYDDDEEDAS